MIDSDIKDIVVVGAGGFAREVEWLIERINEHQNKWNFLGFVDARETGEHIVGNDEYIINADKELHVVIAIGSSELRNKLFNKYSKNLNIRFPNLIDPSVIISKRILMGEGNILCAGNIITVDVEMGNFNILNLDCTIGHDVIIGDYVTINPSCNVSGNVEIGNITEIGTGTQIIQGKKIGDRVIIGAGSVIVKDIPKNCTVVGVPGKIIKYNCEV